MLLQHAFRSRSFAFSRSFSVVANKEISKNTTGKDASKPTDDYDYFRVRRLCSVKDLFDARCYMGHKANVRNVFMTPYIFGNRQGIDIIDLEQTHNLLGDALNFTAHIAYRGGIILMMSRYRQMFPLIELTAELCGEYSHCRAWGGTVFTDANNYFSTVTRLPDLVIFFNSLNNVFLPHAAIRDASKMLIPSVGIVDTNCDPRLSTYPVPGNDDSPQSVRLWIALFQEAILIGKRKAYKDGLIKQDPDAHRESVLKSRSVSKLIQ